MPIEQSGFLLTTLYSFLGGILSVLSPCVLPLIPLYMSYLLGGTQVIEQGVARYKNSSIILNTCAFILGISASFFILGSAFTAFGKFFTSSSHIFTTIGGILIILFGIWLLLPSSLKGSWGNSEARFSMRTHKNINAVTAFIMGFFFSFAWSPCVGPILASVLVLTLNAQTAAYGYFEIFMYTLGFVIPFLIIGLGAGKLFNKIGANVRFTKWSGKIAGTLMLAMGLLMATGLLTNLNARLVNTFGLNNTSQQTQQAQNNANNQQNKDLTDTKKQEHKPQTDQPQEQKKYFVSKVNAPSPALRPYAPNFELTDLDGKSYNLEQFEGHVLLINFWATWCGPCKHEIPDLIRIYNDYVLNGPKDDKGQPVFQLLSVTNPRTFQGTGNDVTVSEIKDFVKQHEITYPVLADETGGMFSAYFVRSFPNTFIIDKKGRIRTLVPGSQAYKDFKLLIEDALAEPDDDNLIRTQQ